MCGLAGIVHWDGGPVRTQELESMAALLRHRGPDEFGTALPSRGVGLSHCRLRVIDLSALARQPMTNASQTLWVCFNGEIYNFRELREELEAKGFSFRSHSDTEVILRAYEFWGKEAIARLDGMFALSLWDGKTQELILARDRTGKKPLFYWTNGACLAFASEIKALFAHPHVPRRVCEGNLPHLLAFGYPPTGETCYDQIRQLSPATLLVYSAQKKALECRRYWQLPGQQERPLPPLKQARGELRELLTQAVRRRLMADVPLGAFLSGGIDSTIVVGLMAQLMPSERVKTFSIGFEGEPDFDETAYAQVAARRFGTDHTEFIVKQKNFDILDKLVWHHDQPFGDSSAIPTYLLAQLTRSQVTVALNGDGGDELFAGYPRFWALAAAARIPPFLQKVAKRLVEGLPGSTHPKAKVQRLKRFLKGAYLPLSERYLHWTSYVPHPEELLRVPGEGTDLLWVYRRFLEGPRTNGMILNRVLELNFHEYLANDLHVKMDRCSMAHGLEARSPFLDTALIEWAFRLPSPYKYRAGTSKWILKQAFRDLLPDPILRRGKMGFGVPLGSWFRKGLRQPLCDHLCLPKARLYRYLDQAQVRRMVEEHLSGRQDLSNPLWLLLTFEVWLKLFDL